MSPLYRLGKIFFRSRVFWLVLILSLNILAIFNISFVAMTKGFPVDFSPQSIFIDNGEIVERLSEIETKFGREDNDFLVILDGEGVPTEEGKNI